MIAAGSAALIARWTARVTSLGVIGVAAFTLVKGTWPNPASDTALAPVSLFFFLSACAGLVLAWLLEGSGGMLAIFSVAAVFITTLSATGHLPEGWLLSVTALNGFLFMLARALHASRSHETASDP